MISSETPYKLTCTSEIVVNMDGGVGGSWRVETTTGNGPGLPQIKLPDRQQEPFRF
jgi:hypothetical protein